MDTTDTCRVCGAALAPNAEWCGQCLTPVATPGTGAAPEAPTRAADDPEPRPPEVYEAPEVSAIKPGPYQFGLFGRLVWTALFVAGGLALYAASQAAGAFYGRPALALVLVLLGIYVVIGLIFLWGVWRPTRVK
ncbi:MAG: hypothetical protein WD004_05240 [Actinomycetota bacterium]